MWTRLCIVFNGKWITTIIIFRMVIGTMISSSDHQLHMFQWIYTPFHFPTMHTHSKNGAHGLLHIIIFFSMKMTESARVRIQNDDGGEDDDLVLVAHHHSHFVESFKHRRTFTLNLPPLPPFIYSPERYFASGENILAPMFLYWSLKQASE